MIDTTKIQGTVNKADLKGVSFEMVVLSQISFILDGNVSSTKYVDN